jgi:hypothetical protein
VSALIGERVEFSKPRNACKAFFQLFSIGAKIAGFDKESAVEFWIAQLQGLSKRTRATCFLSAKRGGEVRHRGDSCGDELEVFFCHNFSLKSLKGEGRLQIESESRQGSP